MGACLPGSQGHFWLGTLFRRQTLLACSPVSCVGDLVSWPFLSHSQTQASVSLTVGVELSLLESIFHCRSSKESRWTSWSPGLLFACFLTLSKFPPSSLLCTLPQGCLYRAQDTEMHRAVPPTSRHPQVGEEVETAL